MIDSAVDSLMYLIVGLMVCTRADIVHVVGLISRLYSSNPEKGRTLGGS